MEIRLIIECEVYESAPAKEPGGSSHLVLLVKNQPGYKYLFEIVSAGYLDGAYCKLACPTTSPSNIPRGLIVLLALMDKDFDKDCETKQQDQEQPPPHPQVGHNL